MRRDEAMETLKQRARSLEQAIQGTLVDKTRAEEKVRRTVQHMERFKLDLADIHGAIVILEKGGRG